MRKFYLIWKSCDKAGIYAIAEIIEPLKKIIASPPDIGYWMNGTKKSANVLFTRISSLWKNVG
jgi:hypothetical protein